jgi:hypothetical protein
VLRLRIIPRLINMTIVTVASWEDRFLLGFKRMLAEEQVRHAYVFYYEEFAKRTEKARSSVARLCSRARIKIEILPLKYENPVQSWTAARNFCEGRRTQIRHVLLDISTMPRDLIWILLSFFRELNVHGTYVYNMPKGYHSKWLSRDPGDPRLIYKLGSYRLRP